MVYNYPFFNFPRPKRYSYYNGSFGGAKQVKVVSSYDLPSQKMTSYNYSKTNNMAQNNFNNMSQNNFNNMAQNNFKNFEHAKTSSDKEEVEEEPFFEIFGLKLYFDDVLLICLIFFLYQEGVKDEYLFMALILLLLS